jgi:hypothetical protein
MQYFKKKRKRMLELMGVSFFEMPSQDFTSFKCTSKYVKKNLRGFKGNK